VSDYLYEGVARKRFGEWYGWAIRSRLEPMKGKARMLKRHLENVLNYITYPITNAVSEGLNSKIQWVKYTARGYANKANFRSAILFHCGGLDLAP
jgi:transposase